jgi:hypothetical protein
MCKAAVINFVLPRSAPGEIHQALAFTEVLVFGNLCGFIPEHSTWATNPAVNLRLAKCECHFDFDRNVAMLRRLHHSRRRKLETC